MAWFIAHVTRIDHFAQCPCSLPTAFVFSRGFDHAAEAALEQILQHESEDEQTHEDAEVEREKIDKVQQAKPDTEPRD